MDILTKDINIFVSQKGIVKDSVVESVFKGKDHLYYNKSELCMYEKSLICVKDDVGYLCRWENDKTIIMYRCKDNCKVVFLNDLKEIKTMYIKTDEGVSIFSMLMDYYDLENNIVYNSLHKKKLKDFLF